MRGQSYRVSLCQSPLKKICDKCAVLVRVGGRQPVYFSSLVFLVLSIHVQKICCFVSPSLGTLAALLVSSTKSKIVFWALIWNHCARFRHFLSEHLMMLIFSHVFKKKSTKNVRWRLCNMLTILVLFSDFSSGEMHPKSDLFSKTFL